MSYESDLSETFTQIHAAGAASIGSVNVSITSGGNIIGQGVTASANALSVSGGNLDSILHSFGGSLDSVQGGGKEAIKHKVGAVMEKAKHSGDKLDKHLDKKLQELHNHAVDLEEFAVLAKDALKESECSPSIHEVLGKIVNHVDSGARSMRSVLERDLKQPKQKVSEFLARNKQFAQAIRTLGAHLNEPNAAGMVSLSFSNINELEKMGKLVSEALKSVDMKKKEFLGQSLANLDRDLTHKLDTVLKKEKSSEKIRAFLNGWKTLLEHHGHSHKLDAYIKGGAMGDQLAQRLLKSREELKNIVNKFIAGFGSDLNHIVASTNEMATQLGKGIPYTDNTVQFFDSFTRLNEYLSSNHGKLYQHLLEINMDQVDSREVKSRFLNSLRVLGEKALEMGSSPIVKKFASECEDTIQTVHKFSDMIKTFHEEIKKEGGNATDTMNELYSIDAAKIEISALNNPIENLTIAIKKLQFFKNIAIFRSNLAQTNKELATYSKDYEQSVGKSIGEAISRITNEYTEVINQISDDKSGMGLEIDMYNESLSKDQRISKEKLKSMYKWQCDARVGLYKTIEAIDLYLLHFTDAITKNPDAVADLHKLLSATRIIARWYDKKAGDNLIRVFESFREGVSDDELEADRFITSYAADNEFADLSSKLGGERAAKVYERCRRAVQGVVVLKNIISYFMSLGEKYGDFRGEKSIYMAPSNIYKNLVNYIWVSALDINTAGSEVLTDNNDTKRLLTYEDTKVKLAQISDLDPETMGINFNKHSIDKLRILKCHNELVHLREATASMSDMDIRRIKQFVAGTFARLGKTRYIFPMFLFGVYDLSQMDKPLLAEFLRYIESKRQNAILMAARAAAPGGQSLEVLTQTRNIAISTALTSVRALPVNNQGTPTAQVGFNQLRDAAINILNRLQGTPIRNGLATLQGVHDNVETAIDAFIAATNAANITLVNLTATVAALNIARDALNADPNNVALADAFTAAQSANNTAQIEDNISQAARDALPDRLPVIRLALEPVLAAQNELNNGALRPDSRFGVITAPAQQPTITFVLPNGDSIASDAGGLADALSALSPDERGKVTVNVNYGYVLYRSITFMNLNRFMSIPEGAYEATDGIIALNGLSNASIDADANGALSRNDTRRFISTYGFLKGFLTGLTSNTEAAGSAVYAQRAMAALHYCVMDMLNTFKRTQSGSVFTIDDTYFVLTIKAVAGKVMTIAGVNSLFKNPNAYRNTINQNKTRMIMGGAESILEDPEVIDGAVELYVRLPLLIEFYRSIFDNANKGYKQESLADIGPLDDEQISFVPELGNIWSNLIKNIFDKSKHIDNGVYTPDNVRKIVSEINAIYGHYKRSVSEDNLVRHVVMELVAEINRRYGVIKRQDLLNYYRVLNSTKRNRMDVSESTYSNNDFDILNEELEFEEKSPSDAFINLKSTLADRSVSTEVKVNKLTDYKILKDFRERINTTLSVNSVALHAGDDSKNDFLTMVDRIRMLKKAVSTKTSRDEKYDLIIKAIEESESMNQSSNDIFACFHELVVVPMRMAYQMHQSLKQFIVAIYSVFSRITAGNGTVPVENAFRDIAANSLLKSKVSPDGNAEMDLIEAIKQVALAEELRMLANGTAFKYGRGIAQFDSVAADRKLQAVNSGAATDVLSSGTAQILLTDILTHFCQNSGGLAKMVVSTTGRITVDLSEFQTLCEYLISNTKFMIDKFTGLVPTKLIESVTKVEQEGTVFWLEDNLINRVFNKINKNEKERAVLSIDNLNKIMPMVSEAIFGVPVTCDKLVTELVLNRGANDTFKFTPAEKALPVIRDAFMQYDQTSRIFKSATAAPVGIFNTLFAAAVDTSIVEQNPHHGLIQEFNTLIAHYLNDLYDAQSRKMYTKLFARFANNAFIDALNGQAFADFGSALADGSQFYDLPSSHGILSAALAYAMKTMSTRTHPISGVKVHEAASIQEVSAHTLEKYRSHLPMYLRMFKLFIERCKFYRKTIAKVKLSAADLAINRLEDDTNAFVRENSGDAETAFTSKFTSLNGSTGATARDKILIFIDDMINGVSSLIEDATTVHKELREADSSVPLFFDIKHDFTKSFYLNNKELPYAPLSTLTMAFNNDVQVAAQPFPTVLGMGNSKFLYGLQSVLLDDFKLNTTKVPYMKKLLADFNGYNTKANNISEEKFNDLLKYLGKAFNFYYDWKFFNGQVLGDVAYPSVARVTTVPVTYQERVSRDASVTIIESSSPVDSKNKIADFVKKNVIKDVATMKSTGADSNPRARVIMVNIIDLGIVPINVHSLMREIPLANLYNYAMTFDQLVEDLDLTDMQKHLLKKPYAHATVTSPNADSIEIEIAGAVAPVAGPVAPGAPAMALLPIAPGAPAGITKAGDTSLRFLSDVVFGQLMKPTNQGADYTVRAEERLNSKLVRNLTLLTLVQYAIKKKVKQELEFINSRVVSSMAAVSNVITNATDDISGDVNDNLFEF